MSKQNKQINKTEKDYYKLNTEAVERLATVNKDNAKKVSDKELSKYNSSKLSKIPVWLKALFVKFWFAGAACFFFYWGLGTYIQSWLDEVFILGISMGIVTDLLTNNVLKYMCTSDNEYYPYMMLTAGKYYTFIVNILYACVVLTCVIFIYKILTINVEPVLFGVIYTAVDMFFITIKNFIKEKIAKDKK